MSGPPPVVHRYRITVHEFRVEPLPKPADRPGESFDYESHPFDITIMPPLPPPGGGKDPKPPQSPYPPNVLPPSAIVRFQEAAVRPPKSCVALRMHQAFRTGETVVKVRAARVEPEAGADSSRVPILTVAIGSSNFHGVELKTVGEPIVDRSYRSPHLRDSLSHGERLGSEYGAAEQQELDHPGRVEFGPGDQRRVAAAAAENRVD